MYYRVRCPRCNFRIEYTDIQMGHLCSCKRCSYEILLQASPFRYIIYLLWAGTIAFTIFGGIRMMQYLKKTSRRAEVMLLQHPKTNLVESKNPVASVDQPLHS